MYEDRNLKVKIIEGKFYPEDYNDKTDDFIKNFLGKLEVYIGSKSKIQSDKINTNNALIFNSVPIIRDQDDQIWQHFCGVEIKTKHNIFDKEIINLMDFDCDQKNNVHFFYTLPFDKNKALIETTWLSKMTDKTLLDYENQLNEYI